jgi:hypothetical protein
MGSTSKYGGRIARKAIRNHVMGIEKLGKCDW